MGAFIELENVSYIYPGNGEEPGLTALDHVNLTIEKGEFVAVIGANGSGKSTLAKHLNGLLLPTAGCCRINGQDTSRPENVWPVRQIVGMVFQNPDNQIVATLVEEDVAFGPENLGIPPAAIRQRVDRALAQVEMEEYRNQAPHLLSGGQKQRVAIAGVLAMQPQCLVLDEATAMLDPAGRRDILQTIRRSNQEAGITMVCITHFMAEALAADRVVIMDNGRVVRSGSPEEIFSQVAFLKGIGLEVPLAAEIAYRLREQGFTLPDNIITGDDLVVALCQ